MPRVAEYRFVSVLYELPSNYPHIMNVALDVPADVSEAFGVRGHVPVVGTADGVELIATLVPVGGGRHRLFLNAAVRGAIGKGADDPVEIRIRLDRRDRTPETPPELQEALTEGDATAAWEALAPSRRKACLSWLADAKRDQTRAARVGRIVQIALTEGAPRLE
ncbi:MAG: YdeI/OmpD-associated family protein [Acidimicrobiaceae bacterium]|nr:YdeI/OmpD-associated family protein [Acidimicrobiaceae bacterium]MDE0515039.1 YdeI/OmpD-associated family protein [Acidimicrobiaceae bacterium]